MKKKNEVHGKGHRLERSRGTQVKSTKKKSLGPQKAKERVTDDRFFGAGGELQILRDHKQRGGLGQGVGKRAPGGCHGPRGPQRRGPDGGKPGEERGGSNAKKKKKGGVGARVVPEKKREKGGRVWKKGAGGEGSTGEKKPQLHKPDYCQKAMRKTP